MQSHSSSDLLVNTFSFLKEHSSLPLTSPGCTVSISSPWESGTSALFRITIQNRNEQVPPSMIVKRVSQKFHTLGLMEAHFYKVLAPLVPLLDIPKFWGNFVDDSGVVYFFLEDLTLRASPLHSTPSADTITTIIKTIAQFHSYFWQHGADRSPLPEVAPSTADVTRAPTAILSAIRRHAQECKEAASSFLTCHSDSLTEEAKAILRKLTASWEDRFVARVQRGNTTIIHGDLHPLGNVWVTPDGKPIVIDWAQIKCGLGSHDIMYLLLSLQAENRMARDTHLLQLYHQELMLSGNVPTSYTFDQCMWDFKFSLLTNLFQSLFQNSLKWFHVNVKVINEWKGCTDVLDSV